MATDSTTGFSKCTAARLRRRLMHYVFVRGLPPDITWDQFKDALRKLMKGSPGWTDIHPEDVGGSGGSFKVPNDADADRIYRALTINNTFGVLLSVHHYDISQPSPILLRCNCHQPCTARQQQGLTGDLQFLQHNIMVQQPIVPTGHSAPQIVSSLNQGQPHIGMVPVSSWYSSMPYSMTGPSSMAAPPATAAYSPHFAPVVTYPSPPAGIHIAPAPPVYGGVPPFSGNPYNQIPNGQYPITTTNSQNLSVNCRNGVVLTEARGVHIANLNWTTTYSELCTLFKTAGIKFMRCDMSIDEATGRNSGSATLLLATKEEAMRAVNMLNNFDVKGLKLRVKLDKETTPIDPPVANGSTPRRVSISKTQDTIHPSADFYLCWRSTRVVELQYDTVMITVDPLAGIPSLIRLSNEIFFSIAVVLVAWPFLVL